MRLAFSAGFLSFLSPCVLPLVPAYIGYLTGSTLEKQNNHNSKFNTMYKSFGFVIGFSLVFILMGASITTLGKNVYINFWATWCGPCKGEMPDIEKLYQETKDTDLVILALKLPRLKARGS